MCFVGLAFRVSVRKEQPLETWDGSARSVKILPVGNQTREKSQERKTKRGRKEILNVLVVFPACERPENGVDVRGPGCRLQVQVSGHLGQTWAWMCEWGRERAFLTGLVGILDPKGTWRDVTSEGSVQRTCSLAPRGLMSPSHFSRDDESRVSFKISEFSTLATNSEFTKEVV